MEVYLINRLDIILMFMVTLLVYSVMALAIGISMNLEDHKNWFGKTQKLLLGFVIFIALLTSAIPSREMLIQWYLKVHKITTENK